MTQRRIVGIDLGTTNTCVAHVRNKVPEVVPSDKGRLVLPSVVGFDKNGKMVVGAVAKDQMVVNSENTVFGHKRLIGRPFNSPFVSEVRSHFSYDLVEGKNGETSVKIGDTVHSLPEVSSYILAHVKKVAEAFLGGPVDEAIITVPAYYNDNQRAAVKEAGRLAGFDVKRLVNEPTAAALAYGFNRGFEQQILVYDLGGGTFDVSILELNGNVFQVVATGGDTFLGGVDFDNRIIDYVVEEFQRSHKIDLRDDKAVMQRVKGAAEAAKIDLSLMSNVVIELPFVTQRKGKPVDLRVPLPREKLNQITRDLVDRTFEICDQVLQEKGIDPATIDEIILVGGQTRMPLVQGRIHQHFGKPPRKGVHPDECVALGAALLGDSLGQLDAVVLVDVLSIPIGIATPSGGFKVVIDKNTPMPFEKRFALPPPSEGGGEVILDVFQGEEDSIVRNEYLGSVTFPRSVSQVTFSLDTESLLHVVVKEKGERREVTLVTHDTPKTLKFAWEQEKERQRMAADSVQDTHEEAGLFASIRKVFSKE